MNSISRIKPPLTRTELQAIQERGRDSADVRALLWEVFRLRAVVLRTHDYMRHDRGSSTASIMERSLRHELDEEPVVQEQPKI